MPCIATNQLSIAINALTTTHALLTCYLLLANFQLLVLGLYLFPHHHILRGKINHACECDGYAITITVFLLKIRHFIQPFRFACRNY